MLKLNCLRSRRVAMVAVAAIVLSSILTSADTRAGDVTYAYDPQGRLMGVVDNTIPSGQNGVSYAYGAGGNITQIAPQLVTTVAIFSATPCCTANAGAQVIVYGDGFSTTQGQNTVKFNNHAATVTASTISTITTTVPSGAGTGPITVSTPSNGFASSAFAFTGN